MKLFNRRPKRRLNDRILVEHFLVEEGPLMAYHLTGLTGLSSGRVYTALLGMQNDGKVERRGTSTWVMKR